MQHTLGQADGRDGEAVRPQVFHEPAVAELIAGHAGQADEDLGAEHQDVTALEERARSRVADRGLAGLEQRNVVRRRRHHAVQQQVAAGQHLHAAVRELEHALDHVLADGEPRVTDEEVGVSHRARRGFLVRGEPPRPQYLDAVAGEHGGELVPLGLPSALLVRIHRAEVPTPHLVQDVQRAGFHRHRVAQYLGICWGPEFALRNHHCPQPCEFTVHTNVLSFSKHGMTR
ncbi:hypothetical protein ACQP1O_14525 [Nocardia sp. CA-151230]|uniref:hypothetical protein n=1 Tax=Nocardia sp. CA-151230 TaxID=3239982 RepID=UPI003D92976A